MTRKQVVHFAGSGPAWPAAYIGFYSDSAATTPVTVYSDQIVSTVLASGKTGSSPVRKLRADNLGAVPPPALGVALYVDSSVTTLYARPETVTGVVVGCTAAVSVASYGPDGPVAPVDPSQQTGWTKAALDAEIASVGSATYVTLGPAASGDATGAADTTAIQALIDAAATAGGGAILLRNGTYVTTGLTLKSRVTLSGVGLGATVLQMAASGTADVIGGYQFSSLTGGTSTGGVAQASVSGMTIEGNKANGATGCGIRMYGLEWRFQDLLVRNCGSHGVWLEWSGASVADALVGFSEGFMSRCKIGDNGGDGLHLVDCHDSIFTTVNSFRNAGVGIFTTGTSSRWVTCHSWGFQTYAWQIQGQEYLTDCTGEGGRNAQIYIQGQGATIIGGQMYAPVPTATGLLIGDSTHQPPNLTVIGLKAYGFTSSSGPSLDMTHAGAGLMVMMEINQASGTAIAGSAPADANLDIQVYGGTSTQPLWQKPGYVIPPTTTAVAAPPALYDPFVGANSAAPDTTKWTVTVGGGTGAALNIQGNQLSLVTGGSGTVASDRVSAASKLATTLADAEVLYNLQPVTVNAVHYTLVGVRASIANVGSGNGYAVLYGQNSDGTGFFTVNAYVSGSPTALYSGSNFSPGSKVWVRFRVQGTAVKFKTWLDGVAEPSTWTYSGTDSSVTAGGLVTFERQGTATAVNTTIKVGQVQIFAL